MRAHILQVVLLCALAMGTNAESVDDALDSIVPESFLAVDPELADTQQAANAEKDGTGFAQGDGFSVEDAFDGLVKTTADQMSDALRPPAELGTPSKEELDARSTVQEQQKQQQDDLMHSSAAQAMVNQQKEKLQQAQHVLGELRNGDNVDVPPLESEDTEPSSSSTTAEGPESTAADSVPLLAPLATGGTQSCESTCVDNYFADQEACKEQCGSTDSHCQFKCGQPLQECACKCSSPAKSWMQDHGGDYHCWTLHGEASGSVEVAMMAAENKALAEGLSKEEARQKAMEVEKVLSQGGSDSAADSTEMLQLKQWLDKI